MLLAGLWPFNFFPHNNVRWLAGRNGLTFDRYGIVLGEAPVFAPGGDFDFAKPWALEIEVTPHEEPSDSLPRLLSLYDSDGRELLILGQWKSELILRILQGERFFRLKYCETGARVLRQGETRTIAVSSDNTGLVIVVDGALVETLPRATMGYLARRRPHARIALGNSPDGQSPWRGDILALTIWPQVLAEGGPGPREGRPILRYRFDEGSGPVCRGGGDPRYDLSIPAVFRAPEKGVLTPPWRVRKFDRSFWADVAVNVLGFVPFGYAVFAWLRQDDKRTRQSSVLTTILLGGAISLAIELLQVYLPTRDSSLTDVLTNIAGTGLGAVTAGAAHRVLHR